MPMIKQRSPSNADTIRWAQKKGASLLPSFRCFSIPLAMTMRSPKTSQFLFAMPAVIHVGCKFYRALHLGIAYIYPRILLL